MKQNIYKKFLVNCIALKSTSDRTGVLVDECLLISAKGMMLIFHNDYHDLNGLNKYEHEVSIVPFVKLEILDEENRLWTLIYDHRIDLSSPNFEQLYELVNDYNSLKV